MIEVEVIYRDYLQKCNGSQGKVCIKDIHTGEEITVSFKQLQTAIINKQIVVVIPKNFSLYTEEDKPKRKTTRRRSRSSRVGKYSHSSNISNINKEKIDNLNEYLNKLKKSLYEVYRQLRYFKKKYQIDIEDRYEELSNLYKVVDKNSATKLKVVIDIFENDLEQKKNQLHQLKLNNRKTNEVALNNSIKSVDCYIDATSNYIEELNKYLANKNIGYKDIDRLADIARMLSSYMTYYVNYTDTKDSITNEILRENFVIHHLEPLGNNLDSCIKLIETLNEKMCANINIRKNTLDKYKNTRLKENNKQWGN